MSNKTHILNIRLDDAEYAALSRLKARSGAPFTSIIRSLIVDTDSNQRPIGVSAASPPVQNMSSVLAPPVEHTPRLSPLDEKLQYQLKLMQAREDLRLKRELERDARRDVEREEKEAERERRSLQKEERDQAKLEKRELERLAKEEKREADRLAKLEQKEADRQAKEANKIAAEKEKAILKAIRSGDQFAGMTPEGFVKYQASLDKKAKDLIEHELETARIKEESRRYCEYTDAQNALRRAWNERYDRACETRLRGQPWDTKRLKRALTLTDLAEILVELEELEGAVGQRMVGSEGIEVMRQMEAKLRATPKPYDSFNPTFNYPE
jgi:hypothetical protein